MNRFMVAVLTKNAHSTSIYDTPYTKQTKSDSCPSLPHVHRSLETGREAKHTYIDTRHFFFFVSRFMVNLVVQIFLGRFWSLVCSNDYVRKINQSNLHVLWW